MNSKMNSGNKDDGDDEASGVHLLQFLAEFLEMPSSSDGGELVVNAVRAPQCPGREWDTTQFADWDLENWERGWARTRGRIH